MAQPIYKTKNGQFSAAIFENEKGNSIALQKSYTDKEGKWQNQAITVFPRDIDKVIEVLQEAKKQCESTDELAPEGAASPSSHNSARLGKYVLDIRDGMVVCSNCGAELKNLNIKSAETGCFYCDEECCKENIKQNEEVKTETLPGGDELIIEEDEEEMGEGDRSEMEEFIEEDEMEALEIWNRCDDVKAD